MEEQKRVLSQVLQRNSDDIPGPREPCMSVSDASFRLKAPRP
jgi:hypothetical protein